MGPEDGGTELNPMKKLPRIAVNYTTHQLMTLDVSVGEHQHIVDKTVDFNAMLKKTPIIDSNPVQLKNSYPAVNSCMDQSSVAVAAIAAASASAGMSASSTPILPVSSFKKKIAKLTCPQDNEFRSYKTGFANTGYNKVNR